MINSEIPHKLVKMFPTLSGRNLPYVKTSPRFGKQITAGGNVPATLRNQFTVCKNVFDTFGKIFTYGKTVADNGGKNYNKYRVSKKTSQGMSCEALKIR